MNIIMATTLSGSSTSLVQCRPTDIYFYDDFSAYLQAYSLTWMGKGSSISLQHVAGCGMVQSSGAHAW